MLLPDPLPQKPSPRWQQVAAEVAIALREVTTAAALAFCYDLVLVVIAFVSVVVTEARRTRNPSLEAATLVLLVGGVLGVLLAIGFAAKGRYWRALGVVLGLIPLFWFAQNL
jgi:hypothetical protein